MQINLNPTSERGASRDAVNRPRETLGDSHLISSDPRSRFGLVCDLLCCRGNKIKGSGFLEPVYQECLEIEFGLRGIPFTPQAELVLTYKDRTLKHRYQPDFVCFGQIILEIKAVSQLCDEHRAQVHNYLRSTGFRLGLLVNFCHHPLLEYERIVL